MADPIQELNGVLMTCAVMMVATCTAIINNEGFTSIVDIGQLEGDNNVIEMAKWMAMHTEANGCVNLGTIMIKHLQVLVFWIKNHQMHSLDIMAANWNQAAMDTAMETKCV